MTPVGERPRRWNPQLWVGFPFWIRAILYSSLLILVSGGLIFLRSEALQESPAERAKSLVGLLIVASAVGTFAAWLHDVLPRLPQMFLMSGGAPLVHLDVSRIRFHLKREEWEPARTLLDQEWADHPGHPELLREWERLLHDGMKDHGAAVRKFEEAVPLLAGDDRAYAYLRLAELNADFLRRPEEAKTWAQRLLTLHPSSRMAEHARAIIEAPPPKPPPDFGWGPPPKS